MQDRVKNTSNITIYWNSVTDEILGDKKVEAVRLYNSKSGEKKDIPVSAFSLPSVTSPTLTSSRNGSTWMKQVISLLFQVPVVPM